MSATALPLRRPSVWAKRQTFGLGSLLFGIFLLAFGVGIGILALLNDRSGQGPFSAVAGGGGMAAWGLIAIGVSFPARPQPPALVNAVAVTPSDDRLPDNWVHLFRRRRMARAFSIGLVVLGVYMLILGGGITTLVFLGEEEAWLLPFLALPFFSGLFMLGLGLREMTSRARLATFGRAPTGLTLGPSGIALLEPHTTRFLPWDRVTALRVANGRTRGGESSLYPIIVLTLRPDGSGQPADETLQLTQYLAPPEAVYTAIVTAFKDAGFRGQLGTSPAQQVLERWTADAASSRSESTVASA